MSDLKSIKNDADLEKSLKRIEEIFFAKEGTPEETELEELVTKVRAYEEARFPKELPEPIEAIKFMMEQGAYSPEDLTSSTVTCSQLLDVLDRIRPLSFEIAESLSKQLDISIEILWPNGGLPEEPANSVEESNLRALGTTPD